MEIAFYIGPTTDLCIPVCLKLLLGVTGLTFTTDWNQTVPNPYIEGAILKIGADMYECM